MKQTIKQRQLLKNKIKCVDAVAAVTTKLPDKEAHHISKIIQYILNWKSKNGVIDLIQAKKHLEKLIALLKRGGNE